MPPPATPRGAGTQTALPGRADLGAAVPHAFRQKFAARCRRSGDSRSCGALVHRAQRTQVYTQHHTDQLVTACAPGRRLASCRPGGLFRFHHPKGISRPCHNLQPVSKKKIEATDPSHSAVVYLAPSGEWAWRILRGGEDLVRGAGYPDWGAARAECLEILNDYDPEAEIVVETPVVPKDS